MAKHSLLYTSKALTDLKSMVDRDKLDDVFKLLAANPRPHQAERLAGADLYRLRAWGRNIIYKIDDANHIVVIARIRDPHDLVGLVTAAEPH